jgi:hypothetical protein
MPSPAACATQKLLKRCLAKKISREANKDTNLSLWFQCRFLMVKMLEWREREHEDEDYFTGNDPGMVNAL